MVYLCHCKQGERRLARKPVHLNFNYWKRTDKAGSDTSFFKREMPYKACRASLCGAYGTRTHDLRRDRAAF